MSRELPPDRSAGSRMAEWDDMVTVGRVARPHGLRGQVVVNPETDFVQERFAPGSVVQIRSGAGVRALTIASMRVQLGRPIISFEGLERIEDVEGLAGEELRIPDEALAPLAPGSYYHHELVGCRVETAGGESVGEVTGVEGTSGGTRLVVEGRRGELLIPLATEIVPEIDVQARRIVITPPEGLLELNETRVRPRRPK